MSETKLSAQNPSDAMGNRQEARCKGYKRVMDKTNEPHSLTTVGYSH